MGDQDFVLERTLGEGAFGKVYLVSTGPDDAKKQYAMKVIDLRASPSEEKELAVKEAKLLEQLHHKYILNYTDAFENKGAFCIVTEFCSRGDLSQYLADQNKSKLDEDLMKEWFRQISSALQYLHGKKIIHRDVKTPNIFLTETLDTKLGDMGLAKVLERPSAKAVTFCGSPYYMSPEIFSAKPYGIKSDIWALGVIVYEMATLERPFDAMLMHQLVSKIIHGNLPKMPEGYGNGLTELLTKMMQKDPDQRPSADDILAHAYFIGSKPMVAPKPSRSVSGDFGQSMRWDGLINKTKKSKGQPMGRGTFEIEGLLGNLTLARKEKEQNMNSSIRSDTLVGVQSILARSVKTDKKPPRKRLSKKSPLDAWSETLAIPEETSSDMAGSTASASDVTFLMKEKAEEEFTKTLVGIQEKTTTDAFDLMCTVISMITEELPKDQVTRQKSMKVHDDQMRKIVIQIEHLQQYCIRVMKEDMGMFSKVEELLSEVKDEDILEAQLISLIGKDVYDRCGIQLLFWRNFEHNLKKLQESQRRKAAALKTK